MAEHLHIDSEEKRIAGHGRHSAENKQVEKAASPEKPSKIDVPAISPEDLPQIADKKDADVPEAESEEAQAEEAQAEETKPKGEAKRFAFPVVLGVAIAALVVGLLVGMFLLSGGSHSSAVTGKTAVSESELDTPIAAYAYNGKSDTISVRDVILQSSSLAAAMDADGNYKVPTADATVGVVRNKLLVEEAESQGITVTDEDVAAYAQGSLGTESFDEIAASYGMDPTAVESLLRESCLMSKLRAQVVTAQAVDMPEPPTEPASDDEDAATTPTKAYADYIIALVGKEWSKSKGTWVSEDGPYAKALADTYEITSDGATYEAAAAAYYIAYQQYAEESGASSEQWTDYVNGILGNSTIQLYTLLA